MKKIINQSLAVTGAGVAAVSMGMPFWVGIAVWAVFVADHGQPVPANKLTPPPLPVGWNKAYVK